MSATAGTEKICGNMRRDKDKLPLAGTKVFVRGDSGKPDQIQHFGADWLVTDVSEIDLGGSPDPISQRLVLLRRLERPE